MNKLTVFSISLIFVLTQSFAVVVRAEEVMTRVSQSKSMKVIDFEGEVVEGINKQSLDSLNQISEEEKRRRRKHLYQKRKSFVSEDQDLISELRIHL